MKAMESEPTVSVGIVRAKSITVDLVGSFESKTPRRTFRHGIVASIADGHISIDGAPADDLVLTPNGDTCRFVVHDVEIGIGFHWDKHENQSFGGALRFVADGDMLWAVNVVGVERYLESVISSEMSATSDEELLKAHAVTSRSWLMAQILGKGKFQGEQKNETATEITTWRDREDHALFDVCADDHCQRYQGLGRVTNPKVAKAVEATRGMVLTYDSEVCDARFSKCCGGMTERFESCWADDPHPYLRPVTDAMMPPRGLPTDLTTEDAAREWIEASPDAFCNTSDATTLRQVLNDYDQPTADFFRWETTISRRELGHLVHTKSGRDLGDIKTLEPLRRGASGRITRLRIVGEKGELTVGKELEIRRLLSPTHLYSSAFVSRPSDDGDALTLRGAGWGHGVGLCQIGAAVMSRRGFGYRSILYHYFRRAQIERLWE